MDSCRVNDKVAISRIGYGAGGLWASRIVPEEKAYRLADIAVAGGINWFDTGPTYGDGEVRLGRAIAGRPEVAISTKVGTHRSAAGGLFKDYSQAAVHVSLEGSLRRLNRDRVEVLLIHGPTKVSDLTAELIQTMVDLRSDGAALAIGASCDGDVAEEVVNSGAFDMLMTTVNVLTPQAFRIASSAHLAGMTVVAKSPLGHAAYQLRTLVPTSRRRAWYLARLLRHHPIHLYQGLRLGGALGGGEGESRAEVALRYLLSSPAVAAAAVGTTDEGHLHALLRAADAVPLPDHSLELIRRRQQKVCGA